MMLECSNTAAESTRVSVHQILYQIRADLT